MMENARVKRESNTNPFNGDVSALPTAPSERLLNNYANWIRIITFPNLFH